MGRKKAKLLLKKRAMMKTRKESKEIDKLLGIEIKKPQKRQSPVKPPTVPKTPKSKTPKSKTTIIPIMPKPTKKITAPKPLSPIPKNKRVEQISTKEEIRLKGFYTNMITEGMDGVDPDLIDMARDAIYDASIADLEKLERLFPDNNSFKEFYEARRAGTLNRTVAENEAMLEELISMIL